MADACCGICLDGLKDPVSTPCGHLHCEKCLTEYIKASSDAISASCPACRATFHVVTPDMRYVPVKYHKFMHPGVRRVYLDASDQSAADLRTKIAKLEERVTTLTHDKELVMQRCESAMSASQRLGERERAARLESERLRKENERLQTENERGQKDLHDLKKKYGGLKGKYADLKERVNSSTAPAVTSKRKSSQAALDSFAGSSSSSSPDTIDVPDAFPLMPRPMVRISKRPRLLGSPFDPEKSKVVFPAFPAFAGRPPVFKRRAATMRFLDGADSSVESLLENSSSSPDVVNSSGAPQRSGLPMGDLFSPRSDSRGSIRFGGRRSEVLQEDD